MDDEKTNTGRDYSKGERREPFIKMPFIKDAPKKGGDEVSGDRATEYFYKYNRIARKSILGVAGAVAGVIGLILYEIREFNELNKNPPAVVREVENNELALDSIRAYRDITDKLQKTTLGQGLLNKEINKAIVPIDTSDRAISELSGRNDSLRNSPEYQSHAEKLKFAREITGRGTFVILGIGAGLSLGYFLSAKERLKKEYADVLKDNHE